MTTTQLVQISLEFWGAFFTLACALSLIVNRKYETKKEHTLIHLLVLNTALLCADALAYLFRGNTTRLGWFTVRISNAAVFVLLAVILLVVFQYITQCIRRQGGSITRIWRLLLVSTCRLHILLLVLNLFFGFIYTFDDQNRYYRTDGFLLITILGLLEMILLLAMVIAHWKWIQKVERNILLFYILIPVISAVLQFFFYGLSLNIIACTISLLLLFLTNRIQRSYYLYTNTQRMHDQELTLKNQELALSHKEAELADARLRVSISQMQPHFLFNALGSIEQLCRTNPSRAAEATHTFAKYLRGNLDALGTDELHPLKDELSHVSAYVWLEKMRFGDDLNYTEDIRADHFPVPVLSVQPLVENAIKHGMMSLAEGVLDVSVSAWEDEDSYRISIRDNGNGFDPATLPTDSRLHVGLNNVRTRVQQMCHGDVLIESAPGQGACFTIVLPKDDI